MKSCSDSELIRLLSADDQKAFEIIYNRYWERLFGIAYNRLRSRELAEEIIQDLFTELWDKRHKLTIYKSLTSYLFCAIKYKILNHLSSQAVRKSMLMKPGSWRFTIIMTPKKNCLLMSCMR